MQKILLISAYTAPFIQQDFALLSRHYRVKHAAISRGSKNLFTYFLLVFQLFFQVRNYDLVYCWFADFRARIAVCFARFWGKKSLVIVGGYELQDYSRGSDGNSPPHPGSHLRYCLKKADSVAALSADYLLKLQSLKSKANLLLLPIAVAAPLSADLLPKKNLVITVCAGSDPRRIMIKGIDVFLKVAELLPDVEFLIIGPSAALRQKILDLNKAPNLQLVPPLNSPDLLKYYRQAKVYCQFSRFESFGSALAEAMLAQCLPVVSQLPALLERINGFGLSFADWSADAAAQKVALALKQQPQNALPAAKWVFENFGLEAKEKLLKNILAEWE